MNQKRLQPLYCEESLQVRKRGARKRALGMRAAGAAIAPQRPRVARELDAVIVRRGRLKTCVSDNGTEPTSMVSLA